MHYNALSHKRGLNLLKDNIGVFPSESSDIHEFWTNSKQNILYSCWAGKFVAPNLFSWLTNARVYLPFLDHLAQKLDKVSFVLSDLSCHSKNKNKKQTHLFPHLDKTFRRIRNVHG